MQIRQTIQPKEVSKVETDQREEVSKIKPIWTNQVPDSFEGEKTDAPPQDYGCYAAPEEPEPAEPKMKVDQIAEGILFRQMTAARIGESGNPRMKPKAERNPADPAASQSEGNQKQEELQNHFEESILRRFWK